MAATKANSIVMTEGRPLPQIIRFSVPLALTGILQLLFNAADVIVVGKFDSSTALAAVGATTSLINLLIGAFIGISVGVNILVARYLGCRDDERVSRSALGYDENETFQLPEGYDPCKDDVNLEGDTHIEEPIEGLDELFN